MFAHPVEGAVHPRLDAEAGGKGGHRFDVIEVVGKARHENVAQPDAVCPYAPDARQNATVGSRATLVSDLYFMPLAAWRRATEIDIIEQGVVIPYAEIAGGVERVCRPHPAAAQDGLQKSG